MEDATLQLFTLGDLLKLLCHTSSTKIANEDSEDYERFAEKLDLPLSTFLKKHCILAVSVQNYAGVRFIVKEKIRVNKNQEKSVILFDGLNLQRNYDKSYPKKFGIFYICLDSKGSLLFKSRKYSPSSPDVAEKTPPHYLPSKSKLQTNNLFEIVNQSLQESQMPVLNFDDSSKQNPTTYEETVCWLENFKLQDTFVINYCIGVSRKSYTTDCWIFPKTGSGEFVLLAFRGQDNLLYFMKRDETISKKSLKRSKHLEMLENQLVSNLSDLTPPDVNSSNRSSSVTVSLEGLTHAVKMGFLTKADAETLVGELSTLVFSIWLHFDCANNVRHVCLRNGYTRQATWHEIFPCPENLEMYDSIENSQKRKEKSWTSWKAVFDQIWEGRQILTERKKAVLKNKLLDKIDCCPKEFTMKSSLTKKLPSLLQYCERTKVIFFCKGDHVLHSLKTWFAHYLFTKEGKTFKGVTLKTANKNNLVCLQSKTVDVENVAFLFAVGSVLNPLNHVLVDQGVELLNLRGEWTDYSKQMDLPFLPLVDSQINDLKHQGTPFSPGKIYSESTRNTVLAVVKNRGTILTEATNKIYQQMCQHLITRFTVDLVTCRFASLASLSFKCIWLSFYEKGGPMSQALEKTKSFYENEIRKHCRGGFSYSFGDKLNSGDLMYPSPAAVDSGSTTAKAESLVEYDLSSAYGFSASQMQSPGAFCVGFSQEMSNVSTAADHTSETMKASLYRTDKIMRVNTFEYQGVMKVIWGIQNDCHTVKIESVFSNYSPLGIFWIEKYPLDLAIVLTDLTNDEKTTECTFLFQFDGRFAHGCRGSKVNLNGVDNTSLCQPALNRYANDESEEELRAKTLKRDKTISNWIQLQHTFSGQRKYIYTVITDCHTPSFKTSELLKYFRTQPELWKLQEPYQSLCRYSVGLDEIVNCHQDLTYILIGKGKVPLNKRSGIPDYKSDAFMVWLEDENNRLVQDLGWQTNSSAIFTRDTLEYAIQTFGFELESISSCYFYKKCPTLKLVFQELLDERTKHDENKNKSKSKFVKSIVNYSTGMFGFNPHKKKPNPLKIRCTYPGSFKSIYHVHGIGTLGGQHYIVAQLSQTSFLPKVEKKVKQYSKSFNIALPLYPCIVEFGKMRLLQCLQFIKFCTKPDMTKLTYSQVDNLVLALGARNLQAAIDPEKKEFFEQNQHHFFTKANQPGCLKKEWCVPDDSDGTEIAGKWKYVCPFPCTYAIIPDDLQNTTNSGSGHSKMSSLNGMSTMESYTAALRMLQQEPVKVVQERRVNQIINRDTKTVEMTMNVKKRPLVTTSGAGSPEGGGGKKAFLHLQN